MKTCEEILDLISLRLDGELTPEQALALEEHLASCPTCKALADDLADIHSVMPGMNVQPPAFIMENVMERIKGEEAKVVPFPVKKHSAHQWKAWGGIAAALVLVVGGAFVLWGGNASKGGAPMTLDAGMPEASAAPSAYKAAVEDAQGKKSVISLPTPEPGAVPSCAPSEDSEPADEPAVQPPESRGEDKAADNAEKPNTTTTFTAGTEPPQTRNFMALPPQSEPSAAPSTTPTPTPTPMPTPDNRQQTVGLQIAPVSMPLFVEAAKRLYEEKFAELYPDCEVGEFTLGSDSYVPYQFSEAKLEYVRQTADGTSYLFKYTMSGAATTWYLVPQNGSEIQTLDSEPAE